MTTLLGRCNWIQLILFLAAVSSQCQAGTPAPPLFYRHQLVDHSKNDTIYTGREYTQRYYVWDQEFEGPGSPILLVIGGEGAIEPSTGLFYPFVTNHLAKAWGAFVLQPEHRFYGASQPLTRQEIHEAPVDPRLTLLTPEQALQDAVRLLQHIQQELQCSIDRFSPRYCPVISIGGSYPGFLSAMARLRFPYAIDMAYAASAPMRFYSQEVDQNDYYELITRVADKSIPGCANAVRTTLDAIGKLLLAAEPSVMDELISMMGFCRGSIPAYINDGHTLCDEVMMVVGYTFANANMANYPPDNTTTLYHSCQIFLNETLGPIERMKEFIVSQLARTDDDCVELTSQLPSGPNATISSGDWSGVGTGDSGESWDFQTCSWLIEAIGFSNTSMFPTRPWSVDWLQRHCAARFRGVTPQPHALVDAWHFDELVSQNASRILFTNGLNDGWSVGAVKQNLSESLLSLNFPNGAHHSDLFHRGPSEFDTDDIKEGFMVIQQIFSGWLEEVQPAWRSRGALG